MVTSTGAHATKRYGRRVVCDARAKAKQFDAFQEATQRDVPAKPHNPNRSRCDPVSWMQRCLERLPELPSEPALQRGLGVLMVELDIPERDLRKMYQYWLQVDRDRNGSVDLLELLMWFDLERTEFMVNTFRLLDADGSGELDFVEFCATFYLYCTFAWAGLVKYAFDITDADRSGFIDRDEIESLCRSVYGTTTKRKGEARRRQDNELLDLEGTLKQFDSDGDGRISFGEFLEQNRKHKLLLFPAFELQRTMRKTIMGERYWRRREGPHYQEKDVVIRELQRAMVPDGAAEPLVHKKKKKVGKARAYGKAGRVHTFVRSLSGKLKLPQSPKVSGLVKQLSAKSLKLRRRLSFTKTRNAPVRGVISATGKRRR
jgi:serine/threonine-protein phosphatase 2B regulatory subunit